MERKHHPKIAVHHGRQHGNRHKDRTENTDPLNLLVGVIFKASDKVAVDVSFKEGLNNESPDWSFGVGASIMFEQVA